MEIWYVILNLVFAIWVLFDGHKRKTNVIAWAIGTFAIGPIVFPVYIAKRPPLNTVEFQLNTEEFQEGRASNSGEYQEGRASWNFLKSFAFFGTIVVWTVLLVFAGIWKEKPVANAVSETPEYKLAVYSAKDYVSQDDNNVDRFQSALDRLSEHYVENRQQIVNISVIAHKKVKVLGAKDESMVSIMEDLDNVFCYNDLKNQNYGEYAAIYIRLRRGGQSHIEAIGTLQAIVRGY